MSLSTRRRGECEELCRKRGELERLLGVKEVDFDKCVRICRAFASS